MEAPFWKCITYDPSPWAVLTLARMPYLYVRTVIVNFTMAAGAIDFEWQ